VLERRIGAAPTMRRRELRRRRSISVGGEGEKKCGSSDRQCRVEIMSSHTPSPDRILAVDRWMCGVEQSARLKNLNRWMKIQRV
jgi:hypothetical protein